MRRSFGKKEHDAPKCVQGKKKEKNGAPSPPCCFSPVCSSHFSKESLSIYYYQPVCRQTTFTTCCRGESLPVVSHTRARFSLRFDATCARVQIRKKKKMCRKGHSTTLTKQPFSISVLCYSNHCSHVRSIFNVWKKKKKKVFMSPGFHCLFVAGCKEK